MIEWCVICLLFCRGRVLLLELVSICMVLCIGVLCGMGLFVVLLGLVMFLVVSMFKGFMWVIKFLI